MFLEDCSLQYDSAHYFPIFKAVMLVNDIKNVIYESLHYNIS